MKYTEKELASAIENLIELLHKYAPEADVDAVIEKHRVVDEINQFGPAGPCGMGLGKFGGHAV